MTRKPRTTATQSSVRQRLAAAGVALMLPTDAELTVAGFDTTTSLDLIEGANRNIIFLFGN